LVFSQTDLMMVNAIIITGVLILLSVSIIGPTETETSSFTFLWRIGVAAVAYPFAASALTQLFKITSKNEEKSTEASRMSISWMKFGFVYLLIMIFAMMGIQFYFFSNL